ncbi:P2X purinoceptor 7 [Ixodes scapularis]
MADLPELQRRLLQRSRLLGFEPWSDSPLRQTGDRTSSDNDSSGDDIDCEGTACAGSRHRHANPTTSRARASPDHQPPEPDRLGHTGWCTCGRCVPMPTDLESVCCREVPAATRKQPSDCLTTHPHFHTLCLDEVVLDVAIQMLQDHGIRVENTRKYRHTSYSQLAHWLWGRLGRNRRRVLPACAVNRIRERFPSEGYTGFQYAYNL